MTGDDPRFEPDPDDEDIRFAEEESRRRYEAERADRLAEKGPSDLLLWRHPEARIRHRNRKVAA